MIAMNRPGGYLEFIMRGLLADGYSMNALRVALFDAGDADNQSTEAERKRADEEYCHPSDNCIEVDSDALVSRADDGVWVQAWLWLQNDENEE